MLTINVRMDDRVVRELTRIGDTLVALKDELQALIAAFNTATNSVADAIAKLKQQIADLLANPDAITPEDKAAVEAGFQAQIDRLTTLGADPANPVPPTP